MAERSLFAKTLAEDEKRGEERSGEERRGEETRKEEKRRWRCIRAGFGCA